MNFFYEHILLIPTISFVLSVFIKGFVSYIKKGKFDINIALGSGGMPSAHTALTVSLTTALALKNGFFSDFFVLSLCFTIIIIYDAINVRYEAGLHAGALNKHIGQRKFRESLGHLPSEAFAGAILGILVSVILFYI